MIALRPKFANVNEMTPKMIAQILYDGPEGKRVSKVSAQLVIKPTDVLRHASVTVMASTSRPNVPK